MKLEGWIAVSKSETTWVAGQDKEDVVLLTNRYNRILWNDPVPCTITIPPSGEEVEDATI